MRRNGGIVPTCYIISIKKSGVTIFAQLFWRLTKRKSIFAQRSIGSHNRKAGCANNLPINAALISLAACNW